MKMDNAEEIFHFLEDFSKRKPKTIPQELNDYLAYVARTGDPVYQWSLVKSLFKEKLMNVITDFYETTPSIEIPPYPNVDPFNYDTMKNGLIERLDSFSSAPFTIQRICELLTYPRKQYNRVDKFMRAIEKNILVVSTREPGTQRHIEPENGEAMEPIVNGSDNSDYNVDVEMEDMSWKQNMESQRISEPQPSSSDTHISVDDIETRLKANQDASMEIQDKVSTQYESVTPPELNVTTDEQMVQSSTNLEAEQQSASASEDNKSKEIENEDKPKIDIEMKTEDCEEKPNLTIPEIKIDDAEMTEKRLSEETQLGKSEKGDSSDSENTEIDNNKSHVDDHQSNIDESSSDSNSKEELDSKHISEIQTSSEESSSSSDNTDGNSNSPKTADNTVDSAEDSNLSDSNVIEGEKEDKVSDQEKKDDNTCDDAPATIQTDNYSISDVKSELPQPQIEETKVEEDTTKPLIESIPIVEETLKETEKEVSENKETIVVENPSTSTTMD